MSDAILEEEEEGGREDGYGDEHEETAVSPLPSFHKQGSPAAGKHQRQRQSSVMGFLGNVFTRRQTSATGDLEDGASTSQTPQSKRTASISLDEHGEVLVTPSQARSVASVTCSTSPI
jgi:hypothetical protein